MSLDHLAGKLEFHLIVWLDQIHCESLDPAGKSQIKRVYRLGRRAHFDIITEIQARVSKYAFKSKINFKRRF